MVHSLINLQLPLTYVMNNLSRGLRVPDRYPLVLIEPMIAKLRFIYETQRPQPSEGGPLLGCWRKAHVAGGGPDCIDHGRSASRGSVDAAEPRRLTARSGCRLPVGGDTFQRK